MSSRRIYLDHNATAPLLPAARAAMVDALAVDANPSSVHADGRAARRIVDAARRDVAALVGAKPEHVVFTSGATEAATTLLTPDWRMARAPLKVSRLYVTTAEHPCVACGGRFASADIETIPVDGNGLIDLPALSAALASHDRAAGLPMLALHAAHNETGVVQPWREAGRIAKAAGAIVVVDAVQAVGRISLDLADGCADFLILSSHKLGGPKGVGAFVGASDLLMPAPLIVGGGQEKGHRAGTENLAGIAGFGAACREAETNPAGMDAVRALRDRFERTVLDLVPDAVIHGAAAPRLPNTLFFGVPGLKAETAQIAFDLDGVSVSSGSACSSGKVGPSPVLKAMGVEADEGAIRVSIGIATTDCDVERFSAALSRIASRRGSVAEARAA